MQLQSVAQLSPQWYASHAGIQCKFLGFLVCFESQACTHGRWIHGWLQGGVGVGGRGGGVGGGGENEGGGVRMKVVEGQYGRERETDRQTQTDRQTDRDRERQRERVGEGEERERVSGEGEKSVRPSDFIMETISVGVGYDGEERDQRMWAGEGCANERKMVAGGEKSQSDPGT